MDCKTLDKLHEGVLLFNSMKVILDLGYYLKSGTVYKDHYKLYECPFCSNPFITSANRINSGNTKSCGCNKSNAIRKAQIKHGMASARINKIFRGMKDRCFNSNSPNFKDYGGRGITICNEWLNDFMAFYNWATNNGYDEKLTIDRINNDGNYEPNNCKWATKLEQCNNQRLIKSTNTSGFAGVCFCKEHNKFRASLVYDKKRYSIGYFITPQEAAIARNIFIIKNKFPHKLNEIT
jgi:hypothetical protein